MASRSKDHLRSFLALFLAFDFPARWTHYDTQRSVVDKIGTRAEMGRAGENVDPKPGWVASESSIFAPESKLKPWELKSSTTFGNANSSFVQCQISCNHFFLNSR